MNVWPLANEWLCFAGTLAVELAVVFAAAKLLALATKSAQAQRAIWQVALCSALLILIGELNGVSRWVPVPHKRAISQASTQRAVVITLEDGPNIPAPNTQPPAITEEEFFAVTPERHLRWPAVLWIAGSVLVLLRLAFAEVVALVIRHRSRRIDVRADVTVRAPDATLSARVSRIAAALGVRSEVSLLENPRVIAPFTFGTRKPVIVLPHDFTSTFTPAQQDAVLAHELAHVAGRDFTWRRFAEIVCALLWWHPAVWLSKRELHHASELVADEASLLLSDGSQHLAECLLVCAKQLHRPALIGWLGIDGGGFRSKLGKRVARLLESKQRAASRRVPWPLRLIATIACVVALWFGTAIATHSGGDGNKAWRHSILGTAFAALAEVPTQSPEDIRIETAQTVRDATTDSLSTSNRGTSNGKTQLLSELPYLGRFFRHSRETNSREETSDPAVQIASKDETSIATAQLIQNGKLYYETGRLNESETALRRAIKQDPHNKAAAYYLDLVNARLYSENLRLRALDSDEIGNAQPVPKLTTRTNLNYIRAARQRLYDKLKAIRLREFMVDKLPLGEVIKVLSDEVRRLDPDPDPATKGVHFLINSADPATGEALDLVGGVTITVSKPLRDISLEEALNVITMVADKKIRYSVEDYGVVISSKPPETQPLHTRFFKVDTKTFWENLANVTAFSFSGTRTNHGGGDIRSFGRGTNAGVSFIASNDASAVIPAIKSFLQVAGVDLNEEGKAVFLNDRLGYLMVRATIPDLDTIEKAVQMLNFSPPQLTIQAKVVEVEVTPQRPLESWYPPKSMVTNVFGGERVLTAILNDEQFRAVIRNIEKNGGSDLLSCPSVTTMNGRQAQIKVVDVRYIVTDLRADTNKVTGKAEITPITEKFELGPVVDVVPYVAGDGYTIVMTILPSVREFLGYDSPADLPDHQLWAVGGEAENKPAPARSAVPLPKFRLRQLSASASVLDGQTIMLSGGKVRDEVRIRDKGLQTTNHTDKALFYFITPRLIDNAGNPLHSDESLREIYKRPRTSASTK